MNKHNINKNKKKSDALERYKNRKRKEIFIIFFILLLITSIFLFLNSSYVKIKNINIEGTRYINNEELTLTLNFNKGKQYWNIDEKNIENQIKSKFNIVDTVKVEKQMLNTINVEIKEKRIVAVEKNEEGLYKLVLQDGEILEDNSNVELSIPLLENFSSNFEKRNIIIKNLLDLNDLLLSNISEIVYLEKEEALVYMKDKQRIKININNFSNKLNYYFDIEKYIEDKENTTLNLFNGSYLENNKTINSKEKKIQNILIDRSDNKNKKN